MRYAPTAKGLAIDLGFAAGGPEEALIYKTLAAVEEDTIDRAASMFEGESCNTHEDGGECVSARIRALQSVQASTQAEKDSSRDA